MRVTFWKPKDGTRSENLLAEAEVEFDADSQFHGLKLVGFSVWAGDRELFVTFPSRAFGMGKDRRYWDLLRPLDAPSTPAGKSAVAKLKAWILEEYVAQAQSIQSAQRVRQDPDHGRGYGGAK